VSVVFKAELNQFPKFGRVSSYTVTYGVQRFL